MVEALKYYDLTIQLLQQAINVDPDPTSRAVTTDKLNQYQDRKVQLKREILKAGLPLPAPPRPLPDVGADSSASTNGMGMGTLQRNVSMSAIAPAVQSSGATSTAGGPPPAEPAQRLLVKSTTGVVYYVGNKLGGGNFGVVHDCRDAFERDFVAKQIRPNRKKEELEAEWAKEVQFLFSLNHPNIVRLFDAFQYDERYYMIMERCAGSVRDFVKRNGPMDGPRVIDAAGQILSGLNHIHCFAAADHQILTNRGFMFLDELLAVVDWSIAADTGRARVSDWRGVTVAGYDEKSHKLVYKQPRALALNRAEQSLVEFGGTLGVVATRNHDMFVRTRAGAAFEKISAGRLVDQIATEQSSVEFLVAARNGVEATDAATPFAALGVATRRERVAFLELYGRWLGSAGATPVPAAWRAAFGRHDSVASWARTSIARDDLRCVARGLAVAPMCVTDALGDSVLASGTVGVSSVQLRDELVELLLHAGYAATFGGRPSQWLVRFADAEAVDAHVSLLPQHVTQSKKHCTTWCFDMASADDRNDGFVVVRRARRVAASDYAALQLVAPAQYDAALSAAVALAEAAAEASLLTSSPRTEWVVVEAGGASVQGNSRDIIHRDLHIDNVLYAEAPAGNNVIIKISDFGISKLLKNGQAAAKTFIGRDYDYAPELVTKGHTTTRSDLYQCGLVLFHLYTGRHVLSAKDGDNVVQVITSGLAGQRAKALNTKLGDVLAVLLRREPDYRFADATEAWLAIYSIVNPQR